MSEKNKNKDLQRFLVIKNKRTKPLPTDVFDKRDQPKKWKGVKQTEKGTPSKRDLKKPTNKWIKKKQNNPLKELVAPFKEESKYIQKKKHIKPIDKVDLGEDGLPKTKIPKIREPREPLPTPGPRPMKPLKAGGRAKYNIGGRANLLEEMGRIDARRHPDAADRAEKRRVIGELNKGYNKGGQVVKTIVSPGTHLRNIFSAKVFKGKPKLAKKGWK